MSEEQLWSNARRWHRQAANDREAAEALVAAEKYAQAAFWLSLKLIPHFVQGATGR